jgi:hypothetical protein
LDDPYTIIANIFYFVFDATFAGAAASFLGAAAFFTAGAFGFTA